MRSLPQQVPRLAIVFGVALGGLFVARGLLIPDTFGDRGHYRAAAVDSIAAQPVKFAGRAECAVCHDDVLKPHGAGNHRGVTCEVCHGPAQAHVLAPLEVKPSVVRKRELCTACHAFDPSRPLGFPQIDPVAHNPRAPCIGCHRPHTPEPPTPPEACSACHGHFARQKAVSPHAALTCETCHQAPPQHRTNPRAALPGKPESRTFCGQCHGTPETGVPQVEMESHGQPNLCWQCHYPHYPEIR
ncbi:MAG: hypothetical protein HY337_06810 [Gemmatimonadetes bacterium]|nr:hypothetical protein [Gemmatimonadota bacterium]